MFSPAFSRRALLKAAAAAAAVAAVGAVSRRAVSRAREIRARLLGEALVRGHELRIWREATAEPSAGTTSRLAHPVPDVRRRVACVVVGGGAAGAAAAWRLRAAGVDDVVVVELDDDVGGCVRAGVIGGVNRPLAGLTLAPPAAWPAAAVDAFIAAGVATGCDAAGRAVPAVARVTPARVAAIHDAGGCHVYAPTSAPEWPALAARIDALARITAPSRPAWPGLAAGVPAGFGTVDSMSARAWLDTLAPAGPELAAWLAARARQALGAPLESASAAALLYTLWREHIADGGHTLALPEGGGALVARLLGAPDDRFAGDSVALSVEPSPERVAVYARNVVTRRVTAYDADAVVLAVAPWMAAALLESPAAARGVPLPQTTPWMVAAWTLDGLPAAWPAGAASVLDVSGDAGSITLAASAAPTPAGAPGVMLVQTRPFAGKLAVAARGLMQRFDGDDARDYLLPEMLALFPDLAGRASRVDILRIGHGPTKPQSWWMTRGERLLRVRDPRVFTAGADFAGFPSLDHAVASGVGAAEAAAAVLARGASTRRGR